MSEHSNIEWTDATWPVIAGCDYESAGCANCYAVRDAWRMSHNPNPKVSSAYEGVVDKRHSTLRWTGLVKPLPERLDWPLRWKKPRKIFVNNQSDLFHPDVPFEFLDQVFWVMCQADWHIYQVLTKRPWRALEYIESRKQFPPNMNDWIWLGGKTGLAGLLPNVWFGVSVENQEQADRRIPELLKIPAAVRFLSCEPLLGAVDLLRVAWPGLNGHRVDVLRKGYWHGNLGFINHSDMPGKVDWVIVGGESGPNSRPMDVAWAYSLVKQCQAANVPIFVKQLGARAYSLGNDGLGWNGGTNRYFDTWDDPRTFFKLNDKKGGNPEEWAKELRVRE